MGRDRFILERQRLNRGRIIHTHMRREAFYRSQTEACATAAVASAAHGGVEGPNAYGCAAARLRCALSLSAYRSIAYECFFAVRASTLGRSVQSLLRHYQGSTFIWTLQH